MKKIINGKLYNTETAQCIADEGKSLHNFYCTTEALYRTTSGNWFLYGESSAGGEYGSVSEGGNTQGYGEDIVPLTRDEVLVWAEHADIDNDEQDIIAKMCEVQDA